MRFPEYGRELRLIIPQSCGGYSEGETPGPIPNPEVKPLSADGTAREASRESRTPPHISSGESRSPWGPAFFALRPPHPAHRTPQFLLSRAQVKGLRSKASSQRRSPGRCAAWAGAKFLAALLWKAARKFARRPAAPSRVERTPFLQVRRKVSTIMVLG